MKSPIPNLWVLLIIGGIAVIILYGLIASGTVWDNLVKAWELAF